MSIINTDKMYAGKELSYEVDNENRSYLIYLGGDPWVSQKESEYIPFKVKGVDGEIDLEASCLAHIDDIVGDAVKE